VDSSPLPPSAGSGPPVLALPGAPPAAVVRWPGPGTPGGGGSGGGGGETAGTGGSGAAPSISALKTLARPRRDYGYLSLGRNYPAEAKASAIEGSIRVRLTVDENGAVIARALLNRLGHGLDELAMSQASELSFHPARDAADRPVRSVLIWTFHFTLPE
jgi:TonB family protein